MPEVVIKEGVHTYFCRNCKGTRSTSDNEVRCPLCTYSMLHDADCPCRKNPEEDTLIKNLIHEFKKPYFAADPNMYHVQAAPNNPFNNLPFPNPLDFQNPFEADNPVNFEDDDEE